MRMTTDHLLVAAAAVVALAALLQAETGGGQYPEGRDRPSPLLCLHVG